MDLVLSYPGISVVDEEVELASLFLLDLSEQLLHLSKHCFRISKEIALTFAIFQDSARLTMTMTMTIVMLLNFAHLSVNRVVHLNSHSIATPCLGNTKYCTKFGK